MIVKDDISKYHKESCDSSTNPASGNHKEPISHSKLKLKAEEFKSNKLPQIISNAPEGTQKRIISDSES